MTDELKECRATFEARYPTELDKRALAKNEQGYYVLMQTYTDWVAFQLGYEAAISRTKPEGVDIEAGAIAICSSLSNPPCKEMCKDCEREAKACASAWHLTAKE